MVKKIKVIKAIIQKEYCHKCNQLFPITELQDYTVFFGDRYNPPEYDNICKNCLQKEIDQERAYEAQFEKLLEKMEDD